jgi:putative tricarboxylic transport membrane protein
MSVALFVRRLNLITLAAIASLILLPAKAFAEWYPSEPVKLVIMAGKGGGADKMARMFAKIIQDEDLSPVPFELRRRGAELPQRERR